jgi:hypothetical protein
VPAPVKVVNPGNVTVTYSGQCSGGGGAIQLKVQVEKDGAVFRPDAKDFGVPCDEYFELSFAIVDARGAPVPVAAVKAGDFFNQKQIVADAAGNVVVQFTPEINGFGSGFLPLQPGLTCTPGAGANFAIRTNYLLTALNDGTYDRRLNAVTDAGVFGSGQAAAPIPADAAARFKLGLPQCNLTTGMPIAFPFPA